MPQCKNCTATCGQCIGENQKMFCDRLDPASIKYNPAYGPKINQISCGGSGNPQVDFPAKKPSVKPEFPPIGEQAKGLVTSLFQYAKSGFKNVTDEEYQKRITICEACPFYELQSGRCKLCGCVQSVKARMSSSQCPDKPSRWLKVDPAVEPEKTTDKPDWSRFDNSVIVHPCSTCGGKNI